MSPASTSAHSGEYVLVEAHLPGRASESAGVLLLDRSADQLYVWFRRDWDTISDPDNQEVWEELENHLSGLSNELGASATLDWLEEHASNVLTITDRKHVQVEDFSKTLDRLYRQFVKPKVLLFRTHLPQFSLRAAAGGFSESMEVESEDSIEVRAAGLRLTEDMFVAHVTGRSMEPLIPDGSLCIFRSRVTGSRNGKLVLVMHYGETGENRFTIKRYRSIKRRSSPEGEDAGWEHDKIILEPLNPEFEPWELEADSPIRVVGEYVRIAE